MKKFLVILVFVFGYSSQAVAYLDPGSASLIIQGLIAGVASVITAFTMYGNKIKSFFIRKKNDEESEKKEP